MRILGGWIALTPEVPVKLLFGRHVWDCAQHADLWGRRLPELPSPAQESEPANDGIVAFMDLLESREAPAVSAERVTGVYRVLKPHLIAVYRHHLADANGIYEPPTRRILQRCVDEESRHVAAGALVVARVGASASWRARAADWEQRLLAALGEAGGITGAGGAERVFVDPPAGGADESPWHPARDVVALGSSFEATVVPPDLAARVDAHGRALVEGGGAALANGVAPESAEAIGEAYAALRGAWERARITGCARIGAYRMVKLALEGATDRTVIQQRWQPRDGGWVLVAAQIVSATP